MNDLHEVRMSEVMLSAMDRIFAEPPKAEPVNAEEEAYFEQKAADILVHLQRARNARIQMNRSSDLRDGRFDYRAQGDHYRALARVLDLMDEFRIEHRPLPEFVVTEWRKELSAWGGR